MKKLIFATGNENKVKEIKAMLPTGYTLLSLKDIEFTEELPETQATIEGNSLQKAEYLYKATAQNCFAEDTGLEIEALDGKPGVRSARYAGDSAQNITKVLHEMEHESNRKAQFKTVITYFFEGKYVQFTGICTGIITTSPTGNGGFGYDPIFIPDGGNITFAMMDLAEKNLFSHRKKAFSQFLSYLDTN